jgi:hypothetical protein
MKRLVFEHPHNLRRLAAELATKPGLEPVADPNLIDPLTGQPGALTARVLVAGDGSSVAIHVPDDYDETQLDAILAAHDPTPDPVVQKIDLGSDVPADQGDRMAEAATALKAYLRVQSPTAAQSAAALKVLIRVVLYLLKHRLGF